MLSSTTTRTASPIRRAALVSGLAGIAIALSGCGGSGLDGQYYDDEGRGQLTIDGSSVTYLPISCEDGQAQMGTEPDATGELNDEGTQVRWASDDEHIGLGTIGGITALTTSDYESGTVITINGPDDSWTFAGGEEEQKLDAYTADRCGG